MKIFLVMLVAFLTFGSLGSKAHAGNLDFLFGYSFADQIDRKGAGDIESEGAFLLGVRYKQILNKGFGWDVGLGLDSIRDFQGSSGELGFFLLEGNASLAIDQIKAMYIFAGLNYPMFYDDKNAGNVDPDFGMQFGTGFRITPNVGVELAYRAVNFQMGTNDGNLWGFAVRGYYTFAGF